MTAYLVAGMEVLPLSASGATYANFRTITGTQFHLATQELKNIDVPWWSGLVIKSGDSAIGIARDDKLGTSEQELEAMLKAYNSNSLYLYRGISGNHFSWDGLKGGTLVSEGAVDIPKATMQGRTGSKVGPAGFLWCGRPRRLRVLLRGRWTRSPSGFL